MRHLLICKFMSVRTGSVPDVTLRPRERRIAKQATGKARPWLVRYEWFKRDEVATGWLAVFMDDKWPKHVHYDVETELEARAAAESDLVRVRENQARLTKRAFGDRLWSVQAVTP